MTTVLDLQALQAAAGIVVSLADGVRVRSGSVTSEAVQGFSDVRAVELVVRVPVLRGHPSPSVVVTVQQSTNGSDWTTGHAFTFTGTGEGSFTLDAPDDYLRVVCAPAGGLREAVVSVVASIVTVDAAPGGGSQTFTLIRKSFPVTFSDIADVWDGDNNRGQVTIWTPNEGDVIVGQVDVRVPTPWETPAAYLGSVRTVSSGWSSGPDYDLTQADIEEDGWITSASSDGSTPPGYFASYASETAEPIVFFVFNGIGPPEVGAVIVSFTVAVAS